MDSTVVESLAIAVWRSDGKQRHHMFCPHARHSLDRLAQNELHLK